MSEDIRDGAYQPHTFDNDDSCRLTSGGTARAASRSPRAMRALPCCSTAAAARTRSATMSLRNTCRLRVATTDPEPCSTAMESVCVVSSFLSLLRAHDDTLNHPARGNHK